MKTIKYITIAVSFILITLNANSQCTNCDGSTTNNNGSAIGYQTIATGNHSFATGYQSEATGNISTAIGYKAKSQDTRSFSLGFYAESENSNSFAIGNYVTASSTYNFVIGSGIGSGANERLVNNTTKSLMVGFNSDKPTFFVGQSNGSGTTGKIGIGNVTDPQAKLHIRADNDENADLLLEPTGTGKYARLQLGSLNNRIDATLTGDMNFRTASDFVFHNANVGIGTETPQAKLQIADGDIFIEDIDRGIIMKSPDGRCWRGTLDNNGSLNFNEIDCNQLTGKTETATDEYGFDIFPNPSKGYIIVKSECNSCDMIVKVVDMRGVTVIKKEMKSNSMKIETGDLPKGYYTVIVSSKQGESIYTEKILVY